MTDNNDSPWIPVIFRMMLNGAGVTVTTTNGCSFVGQFKNSDFEGIASFVLAVNENTVFIGYDQIVSIKVI